MTEAEDILRAKLNAETGKLAWKELERHFARGVVVKVAGDLDLVEVALAVARLGPHRVVYGSDAPIRHQAVTLAKVLSAGLPPATVRDVLWNNAARLLPPRLRSQTWGRSRRSWPNKHNSCWPCWTTIGSGSSPCRRRS